MFPGQRIDFDADTLTRLGGALCDILGELEAQHSVLFRNLKTWWDWYDAKPLQARRSSPWDGSSNVVVPLIRMHSDALISRLFNTVFANPERVVVGRSRNGDFRRRFLPHVADFYNWAQAGHDFDLQPPVWDVFSEFIPIGSSAFALNWDTRQRWMFVPGPNGKPKAQKVELSRGPRVDHVPRELLLWQADRPIQESEIVSRQFNMTWSDLVNEAQLGEFDSDAIEKSRRHGEDLGPAGEVRRSKLAREGISSESALGYALHDVREVRVDWPVLAGLGIDSKPFSDPETPILPLVVTLHRGSRRVLRVIAKPYLLPGWSFYDLHFWRQSGRNTSPGLCKILEHMQRGVTTMVNQSIDAVSRSNSIPFVTTDKRLLDQKWSPDRGMIVSNLNDISFPNVPKVITPDVILINLLFAIGERVTGVNDPTLGRETRLGGHPSPATTTLTLLEQGSFPLRTNLKHIRRQMGRLAQDTLTLYQQFEVSEDKITRALGTDDGEIMRDFIFPSPETFPIPGNLELDLRAVSEALNPDREFQRAVTVDQLVANYVSRVLNMLQVAANSETPREVRAHLAESVQILTRSHKNILEAAQVDEVEDFVYRLRQGVTDDRTISQLGGAAEQQLARLAGSGAGPALSAIPGSGPERPVRADGATGSGL